MPVLRSLANVPDPLFKSFIHSPCQEYRGNFVVPPTPEYAALHRFVAAMATRPTVAQTLMTRAYFVDKVSAHFANDAE